MSRYLLLAFVAVAGTSCIGLQLSKQNEVAHNDIERARAAGAYACAPRELALAEAHSDFADNELAQGDFLRAEEHLKLAVENANKALANSKGCTPRAATAVADRDGDGIPDGTDKCPMEPEDLDLYQDDDGCPEPDNDGDKVLDSADKCRNTPGPEQNAGCPYGDRDGDAINDKNDACPDAVEDKDGDRDGDGRPDLDVDGDGVEDCVAGCPEGPTTPGTDGPSIGAAVMATCDACTTGSTEQSKEDTDGFEDFDGCPEADNDKDGLLDGADVCPNVAGTPEMKGCPDSDGDKFHDSIDKCINEPGVDQLANHPARHGCPLQDQDGDGILDTDDQCPTEPGMLQPDNPSRNGCPKKFKLIEIQADAIIIKQQVQFDTGKATIRAVSAKLLAEVGEAVRTSKLTRVTIEGHTDDVGEDGRNLTLSEARALSVKAWLITKERVDPFLLESVGFGETKPIASNKSANGRQQNRRVEFKVQR
jgi:OmpA-OmpF porin, OOP family